MELLLCSHITNKLDPFHFTVGKAILRPPSHRVWLIDSPQHDQHPGVEKKTSQFMVVLTVAQPFYYHWIENYGKFLQEPHGNPPHDLNGKIMYPLVN